MEDILSYDTEGSDLDVRHGQVFQFGAVRANAVDSAPSETFEVLVRRLPYLVPAAGALAVTGFDIRDLDSEDRLTEYEAAGRIHAIMSPRPGATRVFLTYNGIKHDDEALRTMFWRNLRDPYVTSGWQARRVDALPLLQFADSLAPGAIELPRQGEKGRWRRETAARLNGIELSAHDGVEDARATLLLAGMIKRRVPEAWRIALRAADVQWTDAILTPRPGQPRVVWLFSHFGSPDLAPCISCAKNGRSVGLIRLDRDVQAILDMDADELGATLFTTESPVQMAKSNATPLVMTNEEATALLPSLAIDRETIGQRILQVNNTSNLAAKLSRAMASRQRRASAPGDSTAEEGIYGGFPTGQQRDQMRRFHAAKDWAARAAAASFGDGRLDDMAARLVVMHSGLSEDELKEATGEEAAKRMHDAWSRIEARPLEGEGARWMTADKAREEVAVLGDRATGFLQWLDESFPPRAGGQFSLF